MQHIVGDLLAVKFRLSVHETDVRICPAVHDEQFFGIFRLQQQAPVHWYQNFDHSMQHTLFKYRSSCHSQMHSTSNCGSKGSRFHQVLMHSSKRLMCRLSPRLIFISVQPNSSSSISVGYVVNEDYICQLGVFTMTHVHHTLSESEIRKPHVQTLKSRVQCHLSLSAHVLLYNYGSPRCSLPPMQACTQNSGTFCINNDICFHSNINFGIITLLNVSLSLTTEMCRISFK